MPHQPEFVRYETADGVGTITLDRPPLNAYDPLLHFELEQAWAAGAAMPTRACSCSGPWASTSAPARCSTGHHREAPPDAEPISEWDELGFISRS